VFFEGATGEDVERIFEEAWFLDEEELAELEAEEAEDEEDEDESSSVFGVFRTG
jgi:hypothetical protein